MSEYTPRESLSEALSRVFEMGTLPNFLREADALLANPYFCRWLASVKADVWDERDNATPQFLGPDSGHYDDECGGYEDCHCESYPNPYRGKE
jgi:hypothetical protein